MQPKAIHSHPYLSLPTQQQAPYENETNKQKKCKEVCIQKRVIELTTGDLAFLPFPVPVVD